ncbi:hypothetical protein V6N13_007867 [Hibiscus sabdariffa]
MSIGTLVSTSSKRSGVMCFTVTDNLMDILDLLCVPNADEPHPDCEGVALIYKRNLGCFAKYARGQVIVHVFGNDPRN